MSLPQLYTKFSEYFAETVSFLRKYQWLYSTPNTHILTEKLLTFFPNDWYTILNNISVEELNELPLGYYNENWPETLQHFIRKIESLKPIQNKLFSSQESDLPIKFFKGLSPKKIHEILSFAPLIDKNCKEYGINIIIDIGTGLGYLPQFLHKKYGYTILAIEADTKKIETAINRQKEMYSDSINDIKYIQHFVNDNSANFLQQQININLKKEQKICLIGLHACADLSITLLKLFSQMDCISYAIVMPCCYHRLKKLSVQNNVDRFENFPVSKSLREIYESEEAEKFLTGAFLRLACQNTLSSWKKMSLEDHRLHSIGAMRRNVLQIVADTEGYQLSRLKRKTRITSETDNFLSYLDGLKHTHKLINSSNDDQLITSSHFRAKMTEVWTCHEKDCPLLEVYTAFQTSLQSICENIVLLDRIEMVREWGHTCFARKVTDDGLSPRCYALVAKKH